MKSHSYQDVLREELENSEFRDAYEELEEEFAVAKEIIRLRKAKGWTQRDLADRAQTSQPAVARLESGNYRNLSLSFLRKIGRALGAVPVVHMHVVNEDSSQHAR